MIKTKEKIVVVKKKTFFICLNGKLLLAYFETHKSRHMTSFDYFLKNNTQTSKNVVFFLQNY